MILRPIQEKAIKRIYEEFGKGHKRVLLMAPTGFGKTVIAKTIIDSCESKGNRSLFTVPRINLIQQTARNFDPSKVGVIQGNDERIDQSKPIQIATVQTLQNRELSDIKLTILDEVHIGYEGDQMMSIFDRFPKSLFLGMSATPVDERGYLLEGWDSIIDDFQIQDVIDAGFLVTIENYSCLNLDLKNVKLIGGEYAEKELETTVNKTPILDSILENYRLHANGLKFICFAVSKKHGQDISDMFNREGIQTAFVNADTPIPEREKYYLDFKNGALKGLVNIEILTAGYDEPSIECVIMACPTKSWRKYIQAVGRGVRLFEGKSKCVFLDCGNIIQEHGLATDRKKLIFKTRISRIIDRELGIDESNEMRNNTVLTEEKIMFLRRIGSLLDLYDGKIYTNENDLQEDVNNFLEKTGWFWWRQNSGKMFKDGRWVHFASKNGLPDCTLFFDLTPIWMGIELKLPSGRLTEHQKQTLPEMIQKGCLIFFAQSVFDVWECIKHVEQHIVKTPGYVKILNNIRILPKKQEEYRRRYKL